MKNAGVTLVIELMNRCRPDNPVVVKTVEQVAKIKAKGESAKIDCLCFDGVEDPVYQFWVLRDAKCLKHMCHVVFVGIDNRDTGWMDLERAYSGTKFGDLFLMRVSMNGKPPIVPSQRGMYLR